MYSITKNIDKVFFLITKSNSYQKKSDEHTDIKKSDIKEMVLNTNLMVKDI